MPGFSQLASLLTGLLWPILAAFHRPFLPHLAEFSLCLAEVFHPLLFDLCRRPRASRPSARAPAGARGRARGRARARARGP